MYDAIREEQGGVICKHVWRY